ncbi:MAG TPA: 7-cyano-7-deazaguanine synthase QueC [Thermodesulfobacteriota bacterium]|nr:7-cyano-7-deazaguanine synthase QueC [Thermodesulfobacteriota bacterium]
MNKKAVIILSGGVDSTTLVYSSLDQGYEVECLTILYGQRHKKEADSARRISEALGVSHKTVDLSPLGAILSGSALTDSKIDVPEVPETAEHYDTLKTTIVPNRNAIFLSIAVGYAVSIDAGNVFFGAHGSDRGVYPDCREEFVEAFQASERLATDEPDLNILAPFVGMEKADIVRLGRRLGVPFGETWSCYKGGRKHCGVCSSCRERKRAFTEARVPDPTEYER